MKSMLKRWKLIALLFGTALAISATFIILVQNLGYDASYSVRMGRTVTWTPFEGVTNLRISVKDNNKIKVAQEEDALIIYGNMTGITSVTVYNLDDTTAKVKKARIVVTARRTPNSDDEDDEDNPGAETPGDGTNSPGTSDGGYIGEKPDGKITYKYDPPKNFNFSYAVYDKDVSKEPMIYQYAYLDDKLSQKDSDGLWYHYAGNSAYIKDGNDWVKDLEATEGIVKDAIEGVTSEPWPLNAYYVQIPSKTAGTALDINDYYKGTEKVCGIECWVIETGTHGGYGEHYKYWINPANGHTLKMEWGDPGKTNVIEVTFYDVNFKEWPDGWKP